MADELRREQWKIEHRMIHDFIEEFVGKGYLAPALYPECYRPVRTEALRNVRGDETHG